MPFVLIQSKNIFELSLQDLTSDSIWIDEEYAYDFINEYQCPEVMEEHTVVKIPFENYQDHFEELRDIGRYYCLSEVHFSNSTTLQGLAFLRAWDYEPYSLSLFRNNCRIWIPIDNSILFCEELSVIEDEFELPVDSLYPIKINVHIKGLPEIEEFIENPF